MIDGTYILVMSEPACSGTALGGAFLWQIILKENRFDEETRDLCVRGLSVRIAEHFCPELGRRLPARSWTASAPRCTGTRS